jgi:YHS domain-containing protein
MGSLLADIIEFVALLLFLRAMFRGISSLFNSPRIHIRTTGSVPRPSQAPEPHRGEMARDPVCGMFVSTELPHTLRRGNETLHFCSSQCMEKYGKGSTNATS